LFSIYDKGEATMANFDPAKSRQELRTTAVAKLGPRLAFPDQCALFIAARDRMAPHPILAQAFGVTPATVSAIANCLNPARRIHKYTSVAKEYDKLGDELFAQRYWREEHAARILRLKYDAAEPGDDRRLRGPNLAADKFSAANHGVFTIPHPTGAAPYSVRIEWLTHPYNQATGWFFIFGEDEPHGREAMGELEDFQPTPFRTSAEAYDAAFVMVGESSPRPKPGRPKK
jgi:hypothetical protein